MHKTFTIDWDNLAEIKKLQSTLKGRACLLSQAVGVPTKKERKQKSLDYCFEIYNKNLDDVFISKDNKISDYYVYIHCNPIKPIEVLRHPKEAFAATLGAESLPFYVGKGRGDRAYKLERNETYAKVCQMLNARDLKPEIKIVQSNLLEHKALEIEAKLIDIFGLQIYGGYLTNLDEGHSASFRRERYQTEFNLLNKEHSALFKMQ